MIKNAVIDERLIHGQIVVDWSRYLGVNAIIVGNDMAATNSVVEMTLRMAAPTGIKVGIKTVRGSYRCPQTPANGTISSSSVSQQSTGCNANR